MEFTKMTEVVVTSYTWQNYNINQRGADTIHAVSMTKYQKYLSILNILAKVIKSHDLNLYKITPYNKCTVLKSTYAQLPYWKLVARKRFQNQV